VSHPALLRRHDSEARPAPDPDTELTTMTPRLQGYLKAAPDGIKAMMALEASIAASGLEHALLELVKMRASQINGCAFCLHMHATDARAHGESEMRLYMLNAWRESSLYTPRERAALAWTEALTRLAETGAPDADYDLVKDAFSASEQVSLTLAIGAINAWNRLQVGFRAAHPVEKAHATA
jgi:AhpD family alkylhydroperoxidase